MQLSMRAARTKPMKKVRVLLKVGIPGKIFDQIGLLTLWEEHWQFMKGVFRPNVHDLEITIDEIQHFVDCDEEAFESPDWNIVLERLRRVKSIIQREGVLKIEED